MIRQIGVLLAFFVTLLAAKERRQALTQTCVPEDIVFVVDSSNGVGPDGFGQQMEFIKSTINNYNIAPQCIHVGLVTFSGNAYNQFYLNQYSTKNELFNAIDRIQYTPGPRYTTEGLKYMIGQSFSTQNGARQNARHIGVLLSNGSPANFQTFSQQVNAANKAGINLYTVGVGTGLHTQQLEAAASKPSSRYYMNSQNYDSLQYLASPLAYRTVSETPASGSNTASCMQKADLVFMVDGSGSIGPTNFVKLQNFLKGIVGQLDIGADKVHVGVEQFSSYPSIEFPLDMHTSQADIMRAIDNIKYMSGGTNTANALDYMATQMFSQNSGARANVPRIAVVITDGKSSSSSATAASADQARLNNIALLAVGVGSGVDRNELHSIANDPDSANTFIVNNFDQLNSIANQIIQRACQVRTTAQPPVQQGNTNVTLPPDPCQDGIPNCKQYGESVCVDYAPWSHDNCQRYCGFCTPLYTTAPTPCVDHLTNCPTYGSAVCSNKDYIGWAKDNCAKFCGFCGPTTYAVGFYGKCYYKGQSYNHGEKWQDGCSYECVCEDGKSGRYRCYNKCPLYHNLPAECTLVRDPNQCCQQPVCNFNQNVQTIEQTAPAKTSSGVGVCMYKNKQYFQGQSWTDGCQYQCSCVDGNAGLYKCQDLCPSYNSLPPYCHLVKKAGDCCDKPLCEFNQQQGTFTGTGSISGNGVGITPTTPPPCVDKLPNCVRYGKETCKNFVGWAKEQCRSFCNLCDVGSVPSPSDRCLYQGKEYKQGEGWQVSCDNYCVCEDAVYGYYRCTNSCPTYNNLPKGCYERKKAGQCCAQVECDTGTFLTSSNNYYTVGSGGLIDVKNPVQPQIIPTPPGGGNLQPGTGGTGFTGPSLQGCLYKGSLYIQDQMWEDGCQYSCICEDAKTGRYKCSPKCPTYLSLPSTCQMVPNPEEPCCQQPKCTDPNTPIIPSYQQGNVGHGVVKPPSVTELFNNTYNTVHYITLYTGSAVGPTRPSVTQKPSIGYCMYKGQKYNEGQKWDDGCDYNCTCVDGDIGKWICNARCRDWGSIPKQYCHLEQDPDDTCCQVPKCNFSISVTSFTGTARPTTPRITTPKPTTPKLNACRYNGKQYSQGQVWFDGCKYKCSCDDATVGYFRCTNRCPEYINVPDGCTMVADTNDPACCKVPFCVPTAAPGTGPSPGQNPTLAPGVFPTLAPGTIQGTGSGSNIGYCMYKNKQYHAGDTWTDGCDYTCTCQNEQSGLYQCTDLCPRYPQLPYPCKLITDFRNPCCKVPDCGFNGNYSQISGYLTPAPNPQNTLAPIPGQTPGPNPNPVPVLNYCLYKGVKYYQGQTWDDGCDKRCRCDRASEGLYICNDRCPKYPTASLPKECKLVASSTDSCCQEPKCDLPAILTNITGTLSPGMIPTLAPPGVISGNINTPTPMHIPGQTTLAPQPINYCVYKGQQYRPGQTWDDGCDYTCACKDGMTGHYECTEKCPRYGQLPPQCYLQKDAANPCCMKPECSFNPSVIQFTNAPTTQAPVPGQTGAPTPKPNPNPNPNVYPTPALPKDVCTYKGKSYTQGQQWYDACDYTCTCEDAMQGIYRCSKRCKEYQNLPKECVMVADTKDPLCCQVPQCNIPPSYSNTTGYITIPTAKPGVISGGSVTKKPTPYPTLAPGVTPAPGQPSPGMTPVPKAVCIYKGTQYTQGQKWRDGCDYDCECTDAQTGFYRCTELCTKYVGLPSQCRLITDPYKPCCKKPYCDFTGVTVPVIGTATPAPALGSTITPPPLGPGSTYPPLPTPPMPDACMYNGVPFKQGATWNDGCSLRCVCEDAKNGYYRCNDRCPRYNNVPAGCTLTTDPKDSCCRVPVCAPVPQTTAAPQPGGTTQMPTPGPGLTYAPGQMPTLNPNPTPPQIPTVPAVIIGQGVTPTPRPGLTPDPQAKPVCVYKNVQYTQGQKWDDGCDYKCECIDANAGKYMCTKRCGDYLNLPSYCSLVPDMNDQCCKKPLCQPTPGPNPNPMNTLVPNPNQSGTTLKPGLQPTPNPLGTLTPPSGNTGPTLVPGLQTPNPTPNLQTTPVPQPKNVCVMNGKTYTQGQQWYDGCSRICVCEDGTTGFYRCRDRCRKYDSVPNSCILVADPKDPQCCKVPQCIPGVNGYPTPTPNPNGNTNAPQPITNAPVGVVTGYAQPTPITTPVPVPIGGTTAQPKPTPPLPEVCMYKGTQYGQGQRWQDGCDYNCVCEDGKTGKYKCTERCPSYPALPPYCTMKQDPKDYCCQTPVCDFNKPIPTQSPVITPSPLGPGTTLAPGIATTPSPNPLGTTPLPTPGPLAVCVYKGVTYQQGQTWNIGCAQKCRCDDAMNNKYTCFDRCPSYNIQPGCVLTTDPKDACCQVPSCTVVPTLSPNLTPTPGGQVPNPMSTLSPNPSGTNPTLVPGQFSTPVPSVYPSPVPTGVSGVIFGSPPVPPLRAMCEYKGQKYNTNAKWSDGCQYNCVCIDGMNGKYRCTEKCKRYAAIPSYCTMVQDPKDPCCKIPSCNIVAPTPSPLFPNSPSPGVTLVPNPGSSKVPTPGFGTTLNPNPLLTPSPMPTPPGSTIQPRLDVCIMNGKSYTQGQQWDNGCKEICVCDDGKTGHYTCRTRCPTYSNIAPNCILVPDPSDPTCCKIPQCDTNPNQNPTGITGSISGTNPTPSPNINPTLAPNPNQSPSPNPNPNPTLNPNPIPTPYPGYTYPPNMVSTPAPNAKTTLVPGQVPSTAQPTPAPNMCIYKGKAYATGQKWRDGCDYNCVCENGQMGFYKCTDVCARFPNVPVDCVMVKDPLNPCCKKPDCNNATPVPRITPSPKPGQPTTQTPPSTPVAAFCIFKGIPYKQGQTWNDGCSKVCKCEDAVNRQVTCNDRCPTYPAQAKSCTLVTDPNDKCCQIPTCVNPNNPDPTLVVTGSMGTIDGQNVPLPPGSNVNPATRNVCVYNGKTYTQGQRWDDGCSYKCVCLDSSTGHYQCTQRCARIPKLPSYCTMIQDPNDQCCQKPYCQNPNPTPSPTLAPNVGPGQSTLTPPVGVTPTPGPDGKTPAPNPGTTAVPQPREICVYNNQYYKQDQVWYDGCNAVCRCENAKVGYYRCQERCSRYSSTPADCTLVPDPKDPSCCQVPKCPVKPTAGPTPQPGFIPNPVTPKPGVITGLAPVPTNMPTPTPGITLAPQPGMPTNPMPTPAPKTGCYYKSVVYQKGQTWEDGCKYSCTCLDDMSGQYKCTEKCTTFPNLDSRCVLVQDPQEPCCQKPFCDYVNPTPFPNGVPTPSPVITPSPKPGQVPNPLATPSPNPTKVPPPGNCVYKGVFYTQGQTWNDGCDKTCQCDDVSTGYYSCHPRCRTYASVPAGCVLKTDPADQCCLAPDCNTLVFTPAPPTGSSGTPNPLGTTATPQLIYPSPIPIGSFTGTGNNPNAGGNYQPGFSQTTKACLYKGVAYNQGDKWDDGCDYKCECIDADQGRYRCIDRCVHWPSLPAQCSYQKDPSDACCQRAVCTPYVPTPKPQITPSPSPSPDTKQPTLTPQVTIKPGTGPTLTPGTGTVGPTLTPQVTVAPGTGPTLTPGTGTVGPTLTPQVTVAPGTGPTLTPGTGTVGPTLTPQVTVAPGTGPTLTPGTGTVGPTLTPQVTVAPGTGPTLKPGTGTVGPTLTPQVTVAPGTGPTLTPGTGTVGPTLTPQVTVAPGTGPTLTPGTGTVGPTLTPQVTVAPGTGPTLTPGTGTVGPTLRPGTGPTLQPGTSKSTIAPTPAPLTPTPKPFQPNTLTPNSGTTAPVITFNPNSSPGFSGTPSTNIPMTGPVITGGGGGTPTLNPIKPTPGPTTPNPFTFNPGTGTGFSTAPSVTNNPNFCVYKGHTYNKGQQWQDGCDYNCYCSDPTNNNYVCKARCKAYSSVPNFCKLVPDPSDTCCEIPSCTAPNGQVLTPVLPSTGPTPSPTLAPDLLHVFPVGTHQIFTGSSKPSPNTPGVAGSRVGCVYKNQVYQQGQTWDDACDYVCNCQDAIQGVYKCTSKCAQYPPLPKFCSLVNVPGQCCPSLKCKSPDYGNYAPSPIISPTPAPGQPNLSPQIIGTVGGGTSGSNPIVITPGTSASGFTGDKSSLCIYKGKLYNQGDKWDDQCDFSCECKDGTSGYYECTPRCPSYNSLPNGCYLVRSKDQCCQQPMCRTSSGQIVNPLAPGSTYPIYGNYGGGFTGFKPNYIPGQGTSFSNSSRGVCVYKGVTYRQGQKWDDGCDYTCTCIDQNSGIYQCQARCPKYTKIPSVCKMYDVPGDCCQEVRCDNSLTPTLATPPPFTPTPHPHKDPNCYDVLDNCKMYDRSSCIGVYESWARQNCNMTCGYCVSSVVQPVVCQDKLADCSMYGKSACEGVYRPWAMDNCMQFCGLCPNSGSTVAVPTPGLCVNKLNNCDSYGQYACKGQYAAWAKENCAKYCGLCGGSGTGVTNAPVVYQQVLPPQGWSIMMKGVSGAPGDLYQLWSGSSTLNQNIPQAAYLTSQYNGHYKPDLSNHWSQMCIDKVRVAIYNNGQQKAFIDFDARGTNKNSWFQKDRIIASSYSDITTAPANLFSLMGDVANGRQFLMSNSQGNGNCDVTGWIMVATKNGCPFEASVGKTPAFLYSTGQTMGHFDQSNTASGDVFVIMAHSDYQNCQITSVQPTGFTGMARACVYKGNVYRQGQSWADGCSLNCTCTDEIRGFYQCSELCQQYSGLPQGCTLVRKPGECCAKPDCGPYTYNPNSQNKNETGFCYYKGDIHAQDEKWNDGCDYKCTCRNAVKGEYYCADRCLTWQGLPSVCKMDPPAPGKCCSQPNCPSNVILNYPPGYVVD